MSGFVLFDGVGREAWAGIVGHGMDINLLINASGTGVSGDGLCEGLLVFRIGWRKIHLLTTEYLRGHTHISMNQGLPLKPHYFLFLDLGSSASICCVSTGENSPTTLLLCFSSTARKIL